LVAPDTGRRLSIPDVVQNILFFLPFGALGFLSGVQRLRRIVFVTLLGAALSIAVEGLQLFVSDRVSSLGDVLTNAMGALIGAVAAWLLHGLFVAAVRRLRTEGLADADEIRPLAIAVLVLLIAAWQPFDVTLETGTVATKVRSLQGNLWQFTGLRDEGTSLMLAAFFATTLASYLSVLGERRVGSKTAALGVGSVFLLEASQLFIGSRMPSLWDALVSSIGVVIGAVLWSVAARIIWPRLWLIVLIMLTAGSAALQMLSPFEIAAQYHAIGWFPFFGYYSHTTFETLSHVIELLLLYFPLGFWIAMSGERPASKVTAGKPVLLALALTLLIAAPIEYLQGWVVGRYPDLTDVALSLAGAWIGVKAGMTRT
jgi:VanZ family protein